MPRSKPAKPRNVRRSIPQHRRGLHIQPSQSVTDAEAPTTKKKRTARDTNIVPPATTITAAKQPRLGSPTAPREETVVYEHKDEAYEQEAVAEKKKAVVQSTPARKSKRQAGERSAATHAEVAQDAVLGGSTDTPRPRKRKRLISDEPTEEQEAVRDTQLEQSASLEQQPIGSVRPPVRKATASQRKDTREEAAVVNPIGKPGPQRKPKKTKVFEEQKTLSKTPAAQPKPRAQQPVLDVQAPNRGTIANKSMPKPAVSPIEAPAPQHESRKQKATDTTEPDGDVSGDTQPKAPAQPAKSQKDAKTIEATAGADSHKDGVVVNPVGRPGPARKRAVPKNPVSKPVGQEAKAPVVEPQHPKVGQSSIRVSPIGRPGPPKAKKQKQKRQATAEVTAAANHGDAELAGQERRKRPPPADRIPTPPESPQENAVGLEEQSEHKSVTQWLEEEEASQTESSLAPPPSGHLRKRKRFSVKDDDDSEEYQDEQHTEAESEFEDRPKSTSKPALTQHTDENSEGRIRPSSGSFNNAERGTLKGMFSDTEKQLADQIFNDACQYYNIRPYELKCNIIDWTNVGPFKVAMYDAFPQRTLKAITKFCKRRYTTWDSGPWTPEEDEELRKAFAKTPNEWANISDLVDTRSAAQCRDRWKSQIEFGETMEKGPWSQEDEAKLLEIVGWVFNNLRKSDIESGRPKEVVDKQTEEEMVYGLSWEFVAEELGGKRSTKRCYEKWKQLRRRQGRQQAGAGTPAPPQMSWNEKHLSKKAKAAESAYQKLLPGDLYDVLTEIWAPMRKEPDKQYPHESTFWAIVAKSNLDSKFSGNLRRRAFYGALETYGGKKAREAVGLAKKALKVRKKILKLAEKGELELKRAYRLDYVPKSTRTAPELLNRSTANEGTRTPDAATRATTRPQTQQRSTRQTTARKHLSEEYVRDNDSEADEPTGAGAQRANRNNNAMELDGDEMVVIPETQEDQTGEDGVVADAQQRKDAAVEDDVEEMEVVDELPVSSINSQYEDSLRSETPDLNPADFMARCTAAGRRQHAAYVRSR